MPDKTEIQLNQLLKYNRDGSPDRQRTRRRHLLKSFRDLQEKRGYSKRYDLHRFGRKEVTRLVHDWKQEGIRHCTVANRLIDLRWLAAKVNASARIPSNKDLGLCLRTNEPGYGESRAQVLDRSLLVKLDERAGLITELRAVFGLRTKEALKFSYQYATGLGLDRIVLKGSWCKGGRPREIRITNDEQRELLQRVCDFQTRYGERSMIPGHRTYKSYYRDYNEQREAADIKGHEYRHQWAQDRFYEVSRLRAPHAGGVAYAELSEGEQRRYRAAERVVNQELGHGVGRRDITAIYIGDRKVLH